MIANLIAKYLHATGVEIDTTGDTVRLHGYHVHWHYDGIGWVVTMQPPGQNATITTKYGHPAQVVSFIVEIDARANLEYGG